MKKTILGISLYNGHLSALAVVKGKIIGQWDCPDLISTVEQLQTALETAIRETKFSGTDVSFLVEDVQFVHQFLQVPGMRPADRARYVARKAQQEKHVESDVVWRYRELMKSREMDGIVLDICAKSFVDMIIAACLNLRLTPVMLVPLSVLFDEQIRSIAAEPDDVVLVVTATPHGIALLAGTGDGKQFFNRFLNLEIGDDEAHRRLGREITRSVMFADQQFGVTIDQAWIIADPQQVSMQELEPHVNIPVSASELNTDPAYWIWVSLMLPIAHESNFVPRLIRTAWKMKLVHRIAAGLLLAWVVGLLLVEAELSLAKQSTRAVLPQQTVVESIKQQWEQRVAKLTAQRNWSTTLSEERDPMLVAWLLGVLASMLPEYLVLDTISIMRDGQGWAIELNGTAPSDMTVSADALEEFERRLMESPLHARITTPWRDGWMEALRQGGQSSGESGGSPFVMVAHIGGSSGQAPDPADSP